MEERGRLVEVESEEEQAALAEEAVKRKDTNYAFWIGLTDAAEEGTWVYSSGKEATYTAWAKGLPDSFQGDQDCASLWQPGAWRWDDGTCSVRYFFLPYGAICEQTAGSFSRLSSKLFQNYTCSSFGITQIPTSCN